MSDTDNSATRQLSALFTRAWRWAHDCVSVMVTEMSARPGGAHGAAAVLELSSSGAALAVRRNGALVTVGPLNQSLAQTIAAMRGGLSRGEQHDLCLRLGEGRAVVHELSLPEGARGLLPAIVRNKVESLAPWPVEDAIWGYHAGESRGGVMLVTIGIAGRKVLAAPLEALAAHGLQPASVEIAAPVPITIDHSSGARRARTSTAFRLGFAVLATIAVAVTAYGGLGVWRAEQELAAITERTEQLKAELSGRGGATEGGGMVAEAIRLAERKRTIRPMVAVLDDLTKAIPDTTWLTALDYAEDVLTIQGKGGPPTELIKALEDAPAFSAVNFAAATHRDEQAGADVYAISAAIAPAGDQP